MQGKYTAGIVSGACLWGLIAVFVKQLAAEGLGSYEIVAVRVIFSAVILTTFLFWRSPNALRVHWRDGWCFIGTGMLSLVFFNYCYFTAMQESSIAVAAALLYTAPIFVTLFSAILFQEPLTLMKIAAACLTFFGCILVAGLLEADKTVSFYAAAMGLASGIGYALYSIFGKYALRRYSSLTISAYTFIFASIGILPFIDFSASAAALERMEVWRAGLGVALFCTVLPYFFYTYGLNGVEAGRASVLATVEPMIAAMIGVFFFGENISAAKCCGIAFILTSVAALNHR